MAQSGAVLHHAPHHKDAAILNERAPCDGCRQRVRCADLNLACEAYAAYQNGKGKARWSNADRSPTASIYGALFSPPKEPRLRVIGESKL
jgi:hypothetical protein